MKTPVIAGQCNAYVFTSHPTRRPMSASILCVDDDPKDLELNSLLLQDAGFTVFTALDTRSAMEIFMRETIDLVLLDFSLQFTDGGIIAFEMRRRKPNVKIAFLCGEPNAPMPKHMVDSVIGKNFGSQRIVAEVNRLLASPNSQVA